MSNSTEQKQYRLLKDLPNINAEVILVKEESYQGRYWTKDKIGKLICLTPELVESADNSQWFEEVKLSTLPEKKYSQSEVDAIREEAAVIFAQWTYDGEWWHPENIEANKVLSIKKLYKLFSLSLSVSSSGKEYFNVGEINERIKELEKQKQDLVVSKRKFKIGDVVKRPNGIRNMTVEEYRETGKVGCVWFNSENKLRSKSYNEDNLILVATEPSPTTQKEEAQPQSTEPKTVTDNSDVVCLSVNDACKLYNDWYSDKSTSLREFVTKFSIQKLNQ